MPCRNVALLFIAVTEKIETVVGVALICAITNVYTGDKQGARVSIKLNVFHFPRFSISVFRGDLIYTYNEKIE